MVVGAAPETTAATVVAVATAGEMSQKSVVNSDESVEFDEAVVLTGYGWFHYECLVVCAIGILIVGFQNGITSYIFPAAQCELQLTSAHLGFLNAVFLVGGMCSSFFWGVLADASGRKSVLMVSLMADAVFTIILSSIDHVSCLTISRFASGFLIGAPGSVLFSYLGEFQPTKLRSGIICGSGLFFTASWLLLPILAWLILPLNINAGLGWIVVTPWRFCLMLLATLEGIVALWFIRLPESPKFLLAKGEHKRALDILAKMYATNNSKKPEEYPVKSLVGATTDMQSNGGVQCVGKKSRKTREVLGQIKSLFQPPLVCLTLLTCTIMLTNMFGMFGLGLWLPELFTRFQEYSELHPGEPVSLKQLAMLSVEKGQSCDSTFDLSVIRNTIILGVTSLLSSILSGLISTRVSIRVIPFTCMLLGGLSSASIYWLRSASQNLFVACVFQATMMVGNMSISGVVVELFPTGVGAMAICLAMFVGRLGAMTSNVVFGLFMDQHCEIPIAAVAINVLFGALLCWFIPVRKKEKGESSFVEGKTVEISLVSLPNHKNETIGQT